MIRDDTIERYRFLCPHCGTCRTRSYEVHHLTDAGGQTWDYYSLNGNPAVTPTGRDAVTCRGCGAPMQANLITTRHKDVDVVSTPHVGRVNATEAAHAVAAGIDALIIAARTPRQQHFTRLSELNEVISAIQDGLDRLPLLLHELGLTLDLAREEISVHGTRRDDVVTAVGALYGAANTASDLTEPLVDRLGRARAAIASLEGVLVRTASADSGDPPAAGPG